ncbi:MAG: cyclic nucleotide-binding domain-containing protein [Anaerolineae bacterium]|nr:cyclic nucleotide-binding domain-containing protein [Anaerolineae bacterium]
MSDRFQESHIRHLPIFKDLSDYHLQLVAQASQVRRYNQGDFVFRQGEPTRGVHMLVDGQATLYRYLPNGQIEQLGILQNGQSINEIAIFQDGIQTANLQVIKPVTVLLLTRENMATLLTYYPDLRAALGLNGSPDQHLHDVHFKAQRENEEVLLHTRRHWWAYIRYMWLPLFIAIPFWVLTAYFPAFAPIIIPISLLLVVIIAAYLYFEWANDSVMITSQRVVRITHTILKFSEVRDEIAIEAIQEANAEIPSLDPFAWIFSYGQVQLKTAGKEGNFTLDFIPNPQSVQKLIMENYARQTQSKASGERASMRAEVDRWIGSQYNTGQSARIEKPKVSGAAKQKKLENMWTLGDGPISPFVSKFPTDEGATVYRKHWSIWMRAVLLPTIWVVAGFALLLLTVFLPFLRDFGIIGFAAAMVMLLLGAVWFYFSDWDWRHDYYIVTDSNIVIINQRPLWLQSENEQLLLKQVDNVGAESHGIWQRIFKFGDVRVSLVGADEPKIFKNISNPLDVQEEITRRQAFMKQQEAAESAKQLRETMGEYLSVYHEAAGNNNPSGTPSSPYQPRLTEVHDRSRPSVVPHQSPSQPSMSEGRIYQPNSQAGYDYQINHLPSAYDYAPQQGQYQQPNIPQQGQYPPQQQANINPPVPQQGQYPSQTQGNPYAPQQGQYPPQQQANVNPPLPQQGQNPPPRPPSFNPPPLQPNLNPPPPPPDRDTGRPPKFPRRRNES